jgi:uncharacterized membrane protein
VSDVPRFLRSEKGFDRVVFFSDAVVAIAMTLLILPVVDDVSNVTDTTVAGLLDDIGGRLLAFAISFVVIAKFWTVHHMLFEHVEGYTPAVIWWNMAWLAAIVFLPLPTEVLGTLHTSRGASAFYILSVLAVSVTLIGLNVAMAAAPEIHKQGVEPPERTGGVAVSIMILVALAIAVAFPTIGMFAMFALALAEPVDRYIIRRFGSTARATTTPD